MSYDTSEANGLFLTVTGNALTANLMNKWDLNDLDYSAALNLSHITLPMYHNDYSFNQDHNNN